MDHQDSITNRKADHIQINLEEEVGSGITTGLERYHFRHQALPEINLSEVELSQQLFGKTLSAPILISSMTGGTKEAQRINRHLALAAQETQIPLGVGSQRAALEKPDTAASFQVRKFAPDILLFANLGAIQLNNGLNLDDCRQAVEMIEADALILHLNPLQEAVQPEGDTNFQGLIEAIGEVCSRLEVPVIAKEVGWGISTQAARLLLEAGIGAIDVAGAGGTSWTEVEMHRAQNEWQRQIASHFLAWGIPTAETVQLVRSAAPDLPVFASGGLRTGIDIAKCLALGAQLGGMASPFLKAADQNPEQVIQTIHMIQKEIQISMFAAGAASLSELAQLELIHRPTHTHD